jgi:hypothetical protein
MLLLLLLLLLLLMGALSLLARGCRWHASADKVCVGYAPGSFLVRWHEA